MLNFLGYMVFSGFEYCGLIFLMLSIFNSDIRQYKKEFFTIVLVVTTITYVITIINSQIVIIFSLVTLILGLKLKMNQTFRRSLIIVFGGMIIYLTMQYCVSRLALHYGYLQMADMESPFAIKSYVMQTLSSILAITISIYLRIFHGGFGFSLRSSKVKSYKIFLFTTILSLLLSASCFIAFVSSNKASFFNITGVMLLSSSVLVFILSYQRDIIEYSK